MTDQPAGDTGKQPSALRLRVGVGLILVWWFPFWAFASYVAKLLSGLPHPPSVAAVTTAIIVIQTIIGLIGFWVAGSQVKDIVKGTTKRKALRQIWAIFRHGEVRSGEEPDRSTAA